MLLLYFYTQLTATDQGEVYVFVSMKARKFETGDVFRNMSDLKEQSNNCSHLLRALLYFILFWCQVLCHSLFVASHVIFIACPVGRRYHPLK